MVTGLSPYQLSRLVYPFLPVVGSAIRLIEVTPVVYLSQNCLTLVIPEVNQIIGATSPFVSPDDI